MEFVSDIMKILDAARVKIANNMESEGITTTGKTAKSLKVEDRKTSIVLFQDGTGAPLQTTQFGRPAGKVPYQFYKIIRQWILDKGIKFDPLPYKREVSEKWQPKYTPVERGLLARASAIANKIRLEGTLRNIQPNYNVYTEALKTAVKEISTLMIGKLQAEIKVKI